MHSHGTTGKSTDIGNDGCSRRLLVGDAFGVFKVDRVQILTAVGEEVEAGHDQDTVDASPPVCLDSAAGFFYESLALFAGFATSFCSDEGRRFRQDGTNTGSTVMD